MKSTSKKIPLGNMLKVFGKGASVKAQDLVDSNYSLHKSISMGALGIKPTLNKKK